MDQELRPRTADSPKGAYVAKGMVKSQMDVFNETGKTFAIATILRSRKLNQY